MKRKHFDTQDTVEDSHVDDFLDVEMDTEGDQGAPITFKKSYRPDLTNMGDALDIQVVAIDYVILPPRKGTTDPNNSKCAVIRVFGVTEEENSVMVHIHGFLPFFYVRKPNGLPMTQLGAFRRSLNAILKGSARSPLPPKIDGSDADYILSMEIVQKQSLVGYSDAPTDFIKITTALPTYVSTARDILERGITVENYGTMSFSTTYESNIQFTLRYMCDVGMVGGGWIEIPIVKALGRERGQCDGVCQVELDIHYEDIVVLPAEGEYLKNAPLRILSFDIECQNLNQEFPKAENDKVIQIANLLTIQSGKRDNTIVHNIFTYKSCAPIADADVHSFDDEAEMLMKWKQFFVEADPDIVTGYNICNFDLPYLLKRAETLGLRNFPYLGRVKRSRTRVKDAKFSSKAFGTRDSKEVNMEGRVTFDVLQCITREYKLRSYTLNSVSSVFLQEQKEEVHYSMISTLQNGTEETRRRLAIYCLKDAYLPQRLLDKLMLLVNYIEMARVTGVPIDYLLSKGQQIKVLSQLYRYANEQNLVIPMVRAEVADDKYEGATVIEPKKGYYDKPIATLDFSSLYPSIMITHNLCYTTLLAHSQIKSFNEGEYFKTPRGDYFVKAEKRKGILPEILGNLLKARAKAKNDLKNETDKFKCQVLNGRQLALKISANSVYGFTGATVGKLPCIEISASVTSIGRSMIEKTMQVVTEKYPSSTIVYGDTDSVMVNFHVDTVPEAMALGKEAAEAVTKTFSGVIRLEFEKVYYPYLLINKKRYAGLYWTKPDKFDKMDTKGIETVRRDNCELVRMVVEKCLNKILIDRDVNEAIAYAKRVISDLLQNKVDISLLVISKQLSKKEEDYDAKTAHVELVKRIKRRTPNEAPKTGDRIPYVIIEGPKGARFYEKSEDPIYALKNNVPLDTRYYLDNQLKKPLERIFTPIMKNTGSLFEGAHTRKFRITTPSRGVLSKFVVKKESCAGCRAPLPNVKAGSTALPLCSSCMPNADFVYMRKLAELRDIEDDFSQIWTQCQECQKSVLQEVICSNSDCPIYYRREKIRKQLASTLRELRRFK